MNKKQKLRNAVILGLLMSSVTASSAWAGAVADEWLTDNRTEGLRASGETRTYYNNGNSTTINAYNDRIESMAFGIWSYGNTNTPGLDNQGYLTVKDVDNLTINVHNRAWVESDWTDTVKGELAAGIIAGSARYASINYGDENQKSTVDIDISGNLVMDVETRNEKSSYGIYSKKNGNVDVKTTNGSIEIIARKGLSYKDRPLLGDIIEDVDYSADVYGLKAENGKINLDSVNGNIVINSYISDVSDLSYCGKFKENLEELKQGNIYGVSNIGGTVDLNAGNVISITANSANGDAYGIYTNSDNLTTLNSKYNQITAVADGTGTAIGIKAENGSKVDITGDTSVHGDDGALVIEGNNGKNNSEQVTVGGNLFASADSGAVITMTDSASEHITGNLISVSGDENNTFSNVSLKDSSLTVDGYAVIQGGKTGLELNKSTVTYGKDGVSNYIIANDKAVSMNNNSALTVNGSSMFIAADAKSTAIDVAQDSQFTSNGSVTVGGGAHGIVLDEKGQFTVKDADINFIKASAAREDVVNQNEHYNAVNVGAGAKFDVSGNLNVLQAGKIDNYFGSETAVSIVGSDTEDGEAKFILTGELGNLIQGAVYSQAGNVKISAKGNNEIYSAAHGYTTGNDGSEHLVSALYAAEDANINLSTENGVNIIKSNAEFIHKDENGHFIDREITVWAENGGNVNIKGAVDIESSNNATYYENGKNGNALGIAISAGGRDLQTDGENNMITPSEWGKVNVDYSSVAQQTSRIIGDWLRR